MATKCAAAAVDLATGRPRKRARLGWDVAPAAEVNAPYRFPCSPMCNSGNVLPKYGLASPGGDFAWIESIICFVSYVNTLL